MNAVHQEDHDRVMQEWQNFVTGNQPFYSTFRYRHAGGKALNVICRAQKLQGMDHAFEGYLGLVTDATELFAEREELKNGLNRYRHFIEQSTQGFYQLVPENPISLKLPLDEIASAIYRTMFIASCNNTFAEMNGTLAENLKNARLNAIPGGCGPFKEVGTVKSFVESGCKLTDVETARIDKKGDRLNLLNCSVGIVENGFLTAIWGTQRDITLPTRRQEELTARKDFLQRILNSLPGDVRVKDAGCRFLYVNPQAAAKTGVPAEKWIGKTAPEILPFASPDYNQSSIEAMKKGQAVRITESYETPEGSAGWLETVQAPFFSNEGLIEGVVGISLDVTEYGRKEEDLRLRYSKFEQQMETRTQEFEQKTGEYNKAMQQFRQNEAALKDQKAGLEEAVNELKRKIDEESDKRTKWHELLELKEQELSRMEKEILSHSRLMEKEKSRHEEIEKALHQSREELEANRKELDDLTARHAKEFGVEVDRRLKIEAQLRQYEDMLQQTRELAASNTGELNREAKARKETEKLLQEARQEIRRHQQQVTLAIEDQTQALKRELEEIQTREKVSRQGESKRGLRIKELEVLLQQRTEEISRQVSVHKSAEAELRKMKAEVETLKALQAKMLEQQSKKLNAEIGARKHSEEHLLKESRKLEGLIGKRTQELEDEIVKRREAETSLKKLQKEFDACQRDGDKLLKQRIHGFEREIENWKEKDAEFRQNESRFKTHITKLETLIGQRMQELEQSERERKEIRRQLVESVDQGNQYRAGVQKKLDEQTQIHTEEIEIRKQAERLLQHSERQYRMFFESAPEALLIINAETGRILNSNPAAARLFSVENSGRLLNRSLDELSLDAQPDGSGAKTVQEHFQIAAGKGHDAFEWLYRKSDLTPFCALTSLNTVEADNRRHVLAVIKDITAIKNRQAEMQKVSENAELISLENNRFIDQTNTALQASLNPIVESAGAIKNELNLSERQRQQLEEINRSARHLKEIVGHRLDLIHIANETNTAEPFPFDLHGLINELEKEFCSVAQKNHLFFAISRARNVPQHVVADRRKIRQVLCLLLEYAFDNTAKDRLGLHVTRQDGGADYDKITFEVAYTGSAEKTAALTGIFGNRVLSAGGNDLSGEAVISEDSSLSEAGFSLTVCRRYARIMGGDIMLETRSSDTTLIRFDLASRKAAVTRPEEELGSESVAISQH
jgi:PAS domain S-box-containing protein